MNTNKPLDDIFEGLAEMLIENGKLIRRSTRKESEYDAGLIDKSESRDHWVLKYNNRIYRIFCIDGDIVEISRNEVEENEE